ncbi:hypothetical protein ASC94_03580 [Massilia sp. Root418]|uniref:hypothetical protein n=1 Tax=Massilia sp. Root418 TaxID=1736532 RepID=UPI0006F87FEB|nr:hypothetical protein [Massilia sp. Root418]KQX01697.1 hypothetical protein ASC94_03580 [Massilia sp. Root418]
MPGQCAIFSLGAEVRSRLKGLHFALFFAGGALVAAVGGWLYASCGWHAVQLTSTDFPGLTLLHRVAEYASALGTAKSTFKA